MRKHLSGSDCPGCEDRLAQCHENVRGMFGEIKKIKPDAHVAIGWRNEADQETAFNTGASQQHWPMSKHNRLDDQGSPCSLAVDVFCLSPQGVASFPLTFYFELFIELKKLDIPFVWGGDFMKCWNGEQLVEFLAKRKALFPHSKLFDGDHFEWAGLV